MSVIFKVTWSHSSLGSWVDVPLINCSKTLTEQGSMVSLMIRRWNWSTLPKSLF